MSSRDLTARGAVPTIAFALPLWIWIGAIFALSSIPGPTLHKVGFSVWDKGAHFIEYSILGFLAVRKERLGALRGGFAAALRALSLILLIGIVDELYQLLIPGRSTEAADLLADLLGGSTGSAIALLYLRRRSKRSLEDS